MKQNRDRVFSGIQPTGDSIHLGNYHGAVQGMLALQETHDSIYAVVDYHAITVSYDPALMPRRVLNIAADYLAAGLDPERTILMVQSDVPEHVELAWLLGVQMPVPKFEQLPTYKDKKARHGSASFGLLAYPILMAADILIYKATRVPVGKDQLPHIEFTREVARQFNNTFGHTFPEPLAFQTPGAVVPSLKGEGAMAKSVPGS
jgi:tryptophanyl-tRNA synthetase